MMLVSKTSAGKSSGTEKTRDTKKAKPKDKSAQVELKQAPQRDSGPKALLSASEQPLIAKPPTRNPFAKAFVALAKRIGGEQDADPQVEDMLGYLGPAPNPIITHGPTGSASADASALKTTTQAQVPPETPTAEVSQYPVLTPREDSTATPARLDDQVVRIATEVRDHTGPLPPMAQVVKAASLLQSPQTEVQTPQPALNSQVPVQVQVRAQEVTHAMERSAPVVYHVSTAEVASQQVAAVSTKALTEHEAAMAVYALFGWVTDARSDQDVLARTNLVMQAVEAMNAGLTQLEVPDRLDLPYNCHFDLTSPEKRKRQDEGKATAAKEKAAYWKEVTARQARQDRMDAVSAAGRSIGRALGSGDIAAMTNSFKQASVVVGNAQEAGILLVQSEIKDVWTKALHSGPPELTQAFVRGVGSMPHATPNAREEALCPGYENGRNVRNEYWRKMTFLEYHCMPLDSDDSDSRTASSPQNMKAFVSAVMSSDGLSVDEQKKLIWGGSPPGSVQGRLKPEMWQAILGGFKESSATKERIEAVLPSALFKK